MYDHFLLDTILGYSSSAYSVFVEIVFHSNHCVNFWYVCCESKLFRHYERRL